MATVTENSIKIISTATIRSPGDDHVDRRVELTPWDLPPFWFAAGQKGLLFHKPKDTTTDLLIHRLKTSLSRALHFFPPLAGRLSRTDNDDGATASFFIDCNNVGARFVHATAGSVSVSDVVGSPYVPPVVHSFFPLNGVGNNEGLVQPLLAVQVTELVDGVFIGCAINHVVCDGSSFWHFLNSWSEISCGHDNNSLTRPPSVRRWFPGGDDECPVRIPLTQLQGDLNHPWHADGEVSDLSERIFYFGKESVAELKARANLEMGTNGRISSLQAVLAHLWRSVTRNRRIESDDQEVKLLMIIGARPRFQQLPEQYFGNAMQSTIITMKSCEVIGHGIGHVAWEMNKTVGSFTQEKMETKLKHWVENPIFTNVSEAELRNHLLVVSCSPRFDVYGNDFGWGRPVAVRCGPENMRDDRMTVFTGVETGSIEVHVRLLPQTLCAMEKDVEFMNIF